MEFGRRNINSKDQIVGTDEDTAAPVTLSGRDDDGDDLTYTL